MRITSLAVVAFAVTLSACGPPPETRPARLQCAAPLRNAMAPGTAVAGRPLYLPDGCCFVPGATGGDIWCPGSTLSWSTQADPAAAQRVLDQVVVKLRNTQYARLREFHPTCAIAGIPSSCYQFSIERIPGPFQRLQVLAGAVTIDGRGLVASCQFYPGAGRPASCRQLFTP